MTVKSIFQKTMPFNMAKLALGAATVVLSVILFAILMGIGWLFGEGAMGFSFLIWIAGTGFIRFAIMHYMGYLVKAGHIAVIAEAVTTGQIPANQVEYGKRMVTERFATSNIYFAVDKLISGAVKQIQRAIEKMGNALDFIPGMSAVTGLAKFFVDISLGYIDECCLGYTFYMKDQNAFKSAADGVVIYAQNWKALLKNAAKTMVKVVGLLIVMVLIVFIPVGLLFKLLHWSGLVAFLLACLIAWVMKFAFIDSYIMIEMMVTYMQVAPSTEITFDLYSKLSGFSRSFKELFQKGQQGEPAAAAPFSPAGSAPFAPAGSAPFAPAGSAPTAATPAPSMSFDRPVFCGQCGAKNDPGTRFCASCGSKIDN